MEFIQNFIEWISNIVNTVLDFFDSFIGNLSQLFEYIGIAATTAYYLVASLPPWLQAFGTVTVLVSVLFMILGRTTGGAKNE